MSFKGGFLRITTAFPDECRINARVKVEGEEGEFSKYEFLIQNTKTASALSWWLRRLHSRDVQTVGVRLGEKGGLRFYHGNDRFDIAVAKYDVGESPFGGHGIAYVEFPTQSVLDMDPDKFISAVEGTQEAVSRDAVRYTLCGIYFERENVVATDGRRMHIMEVSTGATENVILPTEFARKVAKWVKAARPDRVCVKKVGNELLCGPYASKIVAGKYPDWRGVLSSKEQLPHRMKVTPAIRSAWADFAAVGGGCKGGIVMNFHDRSVSIFSALGISETNMEMATEVDTEDTGGKHLKCPAYLQPNFLAAMPEEITDGWFPAPTETHCGGRLLGPVLFTGGAFTCIVMPMRQD